MRRGCPAGSSSVICERRSRSTIPERDGSDGARHAQVAGWLRVGAHARRRPRHARHDVAHDGRCVRALPPEPPDPRRVRAHDQLPDGGRRFPGHALRVPAGREHPGDLPRGTVPRHCEARHRLRRADRLHPVQRRSRRRHLATDPPRAGHRDDVRDPRPADVAGLHARLHRLARDRAHDAARSRRGAEGALVPLHRGLGPAMAYLPFLVMVVALLLGVPIAFSLATAGIVGIFLLGGDLNVVLRILGTTPFGSAAEYVLTTIPMFILMAYFSASGGLARDLYTAAAHWLSRIKGGLAIATVFACGIFGAMSGASLAAAAVMSGIAMPELRRHGYSDALAAGAIGIGATLDILIPPSVGMVIYGISTQTSIGKLLIAGVIPGIILAIFLVLAILVWVWVRPAHAPETYVVPLAERWASLGRIWSSLLLIALVIMLLYTGVATPTEVGAFGAFLAWLIGMLFGRLTWAGALD